MQCFNVSEGIATRCLQIQRFRDALLYRKHEGSRSFAIRSINVYLVTLYNNKHTFTRLIFLKHLFSTFAWYFLSHLSVFGFLVHSTRTTQSDKSLRLSIVQRNGLISSAKHNSRALSRLGPVGMENEREECSILVEYCRREYRIEISCAKLARLQMSGRCREIRLLRWLFKLCI